MERITPHIREEHLEQIRSVQESADSDISEAEAVRRIFDRAADAERAEAEREAMRSEYESKIESIRSEHESELDALRSEHESEVESVRSEYESRIEELQEEVDDLERDVERLQNEKRTLIGDREERTELVEYVEEQRQVERYRARRERMLDQAGIVTRAKWKLTGVPVDGDRELEN